MRTIVINVQVDRYNDMRNLHQKSFKVPVQRSDLKAMPLGTYILAGNNTANFGGGRSSTGYVVQGNKLIGPIHLEREDFTAGYVAVPEM